MDKEEIEFEDVNKGDKLIMELLVVNMLDKLYIFVLMYLFFYFSVVVILEKLGRGCMGKIKIIFDMDKLFKLGLIIVFVYLFCFLGDKVGEENEILVFVILLLDFLYIS